MSTLSPFREEEALFGVPWFWPPGVPVPGVPRGKWVVLVAGFDYNRGGVNFKEIALRRMKLLIRRNVAAQQKAKTPLSTVIDTAPRFVLFDVASGVVQTSVASQPNGSRTWTEIARFQPVSTANYAPRADGRRVFNTDQAGRMSIMDVYRHVRRLGTSEPGSVIELSILSHGVAGGPVLVNSDDSLGDSTTARDPDDKDGRWDKDFEPPNMTAAARAEFQAAFDPTGHVWVWGCSFANSPFHVLDRIRSNATYQRTRLGDLKNNDTLTLKFSRTQAEKFFFVDPVFFPARGANGEFPLTLTRTMDEIKNFFFARLGDTYCNTVAQAAQVPCFGALPGTYSDYEKEHGGVRVMLIPTRKPPYADNFSGSIRFYKAYIGSSVDPEGRNYGRFDP